MVRMKHSPEGSNSQISSVVKREVEEIPVVHPESPPLVGEISRKSSSASNFSVESDMLRKTSNDSGIGGINPSSLIGEPRIAYPGAPSLVDLWKAQQARPDITKPKPRRAGTVEPPALAGLQAGLLGLAGTSGVPGATGMSLPNPYLLSMASAQAEMLKTHEQLINVFKQQANFLSSMAMCEPSTLSSNPKPAPSQLSVPPTSINSKRKAQSDCTPITPSQLQSLQPHNSTVNVEDDNQSVSSGQSAVSYQDDNTGSPPALQTNITTSHSAPMSEASHLPNPVTSPNQTHSNLTSPCSIHGNGSAPTPVITGPLTSNGSAAPKRKNAISALPTLNSAAPGDSLLSNLPSFNTLSGLGLSPHAQRPSTTSNNPPMSKLSTVSLPSTGRSANRKRPRALPEDLKDSQYWERRRKNNEAAKRSRDTRRAKEDEIAVRAAILQQENIKLHLEVTELKQQLAKLTKERDSKKSQYESRKDSSLSSHSEDDDEPIVADN